MGPHTNTTRTNMDLFSATGPASNTADDNKMKSNFDKQHLKPKRMTAIPTTIGATRDENIVNNKGRGATLVGARSRTGALLVASKAAMLLMERASAFRSAPACPVTSGLCVDTATQRPEPTTSARTTATTTTRECDQ